MVSLLFGGDVMLGRSFNRVLPEKGFNYPWGNLISLLLFIFFPFPILKDAEIPSPLLSKVKIAASSKGEG